ncbi:MULTISPECIES: ATP-binding protein [unclassified Streptomyces]|uniref:ATP-binding protein n=1 Tax=unclassified Streptomyces TaxID=2593676 RepID=UPI003324D419
MPTKVHRFMLTGIESEVPLARREIVDEVRAWGVPLDEETAEAIRLVASELITNAVVHGSGPITVTLSGRSGRLLIDVLDGDPSVPRTGCAQAYDENGRGLALVRLLSARCAWEPADPGKRVWAEMTIPMGAEAIPVAAVPHRLSAMWPKSGVGAKCESLTSAVG